MTLALAGDFGTGNFGPNDAPSVKVAKEIAKLEPDYTIHLGDVYYAGTSGEESSNLLAYWPAGKAGSFTLNSNHEMYSAGVPYFNQVVGGSLFNKLQSPFSFFALENSNWIIVGLDSAYFSSAIKLYMTGTLGTGNEQLALLRSIAAKGKKVIVLTHHNPISIAGEIGASPLQLYTDVMSVFTGYNPPEDRYFGHVHVGAVYIGVDPHTQYRCLGHAALPWGLSSDLVAAKKGGSVAWFETRNAGDASDSLRVLNGFTVLNLCGTQLTESFVDENGGIAWTSEKVDS